VLASCENEIQVPVNVSWDSPENAREFMLQFMNTSYSNTIRSLESSVTVFVPYGTYSATLCTINRCGQACRDPKVFTAEPQPRPEETTCSTVSDSSTTSNNTNDNSKSHISLKINDVHI
jgi:hypothetical protein